jgi:hypothetical protein
MGDGKGPVPAFSILVGDGAMLPNADAACIVTRCDARPAIALGPTTVIADVAVSAAFNCETHRRLGGCRAREYQRKCNSEDEAHIRSPDDPNVKYLKRDHSENQKGPPSEISDGKGPVPDAR